MPSSQQTAVCLLHVRNLDHASEYLGMFRYSFPPPLFPAFFVLLVLYHVFYASFFLTSLLSFYSFCNFIVSVLTSFLYIFFLSSLLSSFFFPHFYNILSAAFCSVFVSFFWSHFLTCPFLFTFFSCSPFPLSHGNGYHVN